MWLVTIFNVFFKIFMYREHSQYQRLTPLDYVCWRGVVVRALGSRPRGETDASLNLITNILLSFFIIRLLSLYSENNLIHYFHCTVRITALIIFTVQ